MRKGSRGSKTRMTTLVPFWPVFRRQKLLSRIVELDQFTAADIGRVRTLPGDMYLYTKLLAGEDTYKLYRLGPYSPATRRRSGGSEKRNNNVHHWY